jgi:hypothetical protein
MRFVAGLAGLLFLSGCEQATISSCEALIKSELKAPSTYKRIEVMSAEIKEHKPPYYSVVIYYDAANSYGTPLRLMRQCSFPIVKGRPDPEHYIDNNDDPAADVEREKPL